MRKLILGVLIIGLFFPSCGITKKYESPVTSAPTEGLFRDETPVDTTTIAGIPWQDFFADSYLRELIGEGIGNNFDLRIAYTRIQQAEANLRMARAAFFPNVALAAGVNQTIVSNGERGRDILGYSSSSVFSLGVSASWEADIWGKISSQKRARIAQFQSSYAYRNLIQTSLIANVAASYYSLIALDEQLRITRETVGLLEESTRTMESLMEAGLLTAASVEQSRALYYATQVTIPDLESRIRQTENAICVLIGRNPGPVLRSSLGQQVVPRQLDHGVPMQMLAKRPDVRQAELAFRSAFELTNAARASFYPSLTLGTGSMLGYGATTLSLFFRPENIAASIIGGLTQPLFMQGKLRGNLKISQAQQQEALLNFEKTVLSAGQEVSDIMYGYAASLSKDGIRDKQIEAWQTSVYFTQELLQAGEANYIEVLTAQQNLLSSQLNQVNDKLQQLQYSVSLYRALGGGAE